MAEAARAAAFTPVDIDDGERIFKRWKALCLERSSWDSHWQDIADHLIPRQARFTRSDHNRGTKTNNKILDGAATRALRILASGIMAGVASPSRAWFRLITGDPKLNEMHEVQTHLREEERRMQIVFARSNIYNALGKMFVILPAFCTAPTFIEDDDLDLIRAYGIPLGSYCLATNHRNEVDTFYRETTFTVAQLVDRFTLEKCSTVVQSKFANHALDAKIDVLHAIEPDPDYSPGRMSVKKFKSYWMELKTSEKRLLGTGGYHEFPVISPRWDVEDNDVYGHGPGMDALPDIKELQFTVKTKSKLLAKLADPTLNAPASMRNAGNFITQMPNAVNWIPDGAAGNEVKPTYIPEHQALLAIKEEINDLKESVASHFMADLFLMMAQVSQGNMTAREVAERHEEKILQLGPFLERIQGEALKPLIFRTRKVMYRRGHMPPLPEALKGIEVRIEYISPLAQAQKMLDAVGIERFFQFVIEAAKVDETALDAVDIDAAMLEYAEVSGAPPKVVRPKEEIEALRAERAKKVEADEMATQAKAMRDGAAGVRDIANAQVENPDALKRLADAQDMRGAAVGGV